MLGEADGEHALVGDRGVREHDDDVGEAQRELGERLHRRHPATGVDEDGDAGLIGDAPDRLGGGVPEAEGLRAGMELDTPGATREAPLRLLHRLLGRVEPAVREQPAAGFPSPGEHPVVRDAVGGMALGIVQRERAGARVGSHLVERPQQLVRRQRLAVLVETEVRMRVNHPGVGRQQLPQLRGE